MLINISAHAQCAKFSAEPTTLLLKSRLFFVSRLIEMMASVLCGVFVIICFASTLCHSFPLMDCIEECFLCPENVAKGRESMEVCANWCILTAGKTGRQGCREKPIDWVFDNIIPEDVPEKLSTDAEIDKAEIKKVLEKRSALKTFLDKMKVRDRRQATDNVEETDHVDQDGVASEDMMMGDAPAPRDHVRLNNIHLFQLRRHVRPYIVCLEQCVQCVLLYGYGAYDSNGCAMSCQASDGLSADPNCEDKRFYIMTSRSTPATP